MGMVFGRIGEETPHFEVLGHAASGTFEVRAYVPSVVARTEYNMHGADMSKDTGRPFRRLAQYIGVFSAPNNTGTSGSAEAIAMTAPVLMARDAHAGGGGDATADTALGDKLIAAGGEMASMSFILPAIYKQVADAPVPKDPAVTLHQLPARTVAVRTFTWSLSEERVREALHALLADLASEPGWEVVRAEGMDSDVDWNAAGYNPPFCVPFLKTNELMVRVVKSAGSAAHKATPPSEGCDASSA